MISQKMRALGQGLSVGLLTTALCAPAALAQKAGGPVCPFTGKDIDALYQQAGFDTKDPDAGMNGQFDCMHSNFQASMSQSSKLLGTVTFNNEQVPGLVNDKSILVYVNSVDPNDALKWHFVVDVAGDDGFVYHDEGPVADVAVFEKCISEMTSSQAWRRWICPNE